MIKKILNTYARSTCQLVNLTKCSILFNMREHVQQHELVKNVLAIQREVFEAKYLGLPTPKGRIKGEHFQDVKKRLCKRFKDYSEN